jgi:hypothetical protein
MVEENLSVPGEDFGPSTQLDPSILSHSHAAATEIFRKQLKVSRMKDRTFINRMVGREDDSIA